MLIKLNKKIPMYSKVPCKDVPVELFEAGDLRELYDKYLFSHTDFKSNLNTVIEIVNTDHVKQFAICTDNDLNGKRDYYWLQGTNTVIVFADSSVIYVSDTIDEIMSKTNIE